MREAPAKGFYSLVIHSLVTVGSFCLCAVPVQAQTPIAPQPFGLVWRLRGPWHIRGEEQKIADGMRVAPGSVLQPEGTPAEHSINVFLPDGERVIYQCFYAKDCARGFRVPAIFGRPDAFATDMLSRIEAGLQWANAHDARVEDKTGPVSDVTVAVLGPEHRIQVAGLVSALPDGSYSYNLTSVTRKAQPQVHQEF